MTAGRRKHVIVIEGGTSEPNALGTPVFAWTEKARLRAEIIQEDTTEFVRASGASDETAIAFRTIWAGAISTADRVLFGARVFNIREIAPTYRNHEIELRCIAFEPGG